MDDVHFRNPHPLLNVKGGLTIKIECKAAGGETGLHPGTLLDLRPDKVGLDVFYREHLSLLAIVRREDDGGTIYRFQNFFHISIQTGNGHRVVLGAGMLAKDWLQPQFDPLLVNRWVDNRFGAFTHTYYLLLWQPYKMPEE